MEKVMKKKEEVMGFMGKEEEEILGGMVEGIRRREGRIKGDFDSLGKYEKMCEFVDGWMKVSEDIGDEKKRIISEMKRM